MSGVALFLENTHNSTPITATSAALIFSIHTPSRMIFITHGWYIADIFSLSYSQML
jgi:hypothetical protein